MDAKQKENLATVRNWKNQILARNYINTLQLKSLILELCTNWQLPQNDPHLPVNFSNCCDLLDAFAELRRIAGFLGQRDVQVIQGFARPFANLIQANLNSAEQSTIINNFQSHRIKILATCALALDDTELLGKAQGWLKAHLEVNLLANGLTLDFKDRDSCAYVTYDLEPLMIACAILLNHPSFQTNWFNYKNRAGTSIRDAVVWLLPYIRGEKTNSMLVNSIYKSDKTRPDYGKLWERKNAVNLINYCIPFDASFLDFHQ